MYIKKIFSKLKQLIFSPSLGSSEPTLREAEQAGDLAALQKRLNAGEDPNEVDELGYTPPPSRC